MNPPELPTQQRASHANVNVRQIVLSLVLDLAMPIVTYFVLKHFGAPTLIALVAGGVFPLLNIARGWIASRTIEPLGIIVITVIAVGTAASLLSGSIFVALLKDSILTGCFGLVCLATLFLSEKPLMFYLLRQFVAGDDPARLQWWEGLWERPPFRAALRRVTLVWGIGYIIAALIGAACAWLLKPSQVVVISPALALLTLGMLVAWTRTYLMAIRDRYPGLAAVV